MSKKNKEIAVIGLGVFGTALVKSLAKESSRVIAVDNNMDHLEEVQNITTNAVCFDATDPAQLKSHGIMDADIAVIAIGEHFEPVVLIAMQLIQAGVKVYARANSVTQEQILKKIGVFEIIHPERQVAERMGITLHRQGIEDLLDIGDGLSVFEVDTPISMLNKTLDELALRKRYGINILTIKRTDDSGENETTEESKKYYSIGIPDGSTRLQAGDKIILLGNKKDCDKMLDVI
ncbi:trk system potassium uptake protein TrkA [Cyclonatronum proteinivorum]|uniref:Trk system potassium uptake protein TrkA n=1 Tax=Cyclonatronum proteinivorum TaxID=1457365 RepID=A0A345UJH0_9BACT|nr:TrkA family potassium uptake protein [Cyclonatronum proteinivorum]AXJ00622.1 trk system potassium uptake protein TrkA [Cyclonatronum proteinivorum]